MNILNSGFTIPSHHDAIVQTAQMIAADPKSHIMDSFLGYCQQQNIDESFFPVKCFY
jgi:hypothetical protein